MPCYKHDKPSFDSESYCEKKCYIDICLRVTLMIIAFLQDFREIQKNSLQIFSKILKKCFLGIMVIVLVSYIDYSVVDGISV